MTEAAREARRGSIAFLVIIFGATWGAAALFDDAFLVPSDPPSTRFVRASVLYAALMTVQPLLAVAMVRGWFDRTRVDLGLRPAPLRFQVLAIAGPLLLAGAAMAAGLFLARNDRSVAADLAPTLSGGLASGSEVFIRVFGFIGMVCLLWVQAMSEEIGWRGYLLPRLMRGLGSYTGLVVHGALWGLWYAPLLVLGTSAGHLPLARCATFVVTCALLGILLGWFRIVSRSTVASATANALLTLAAALPLVLQGASSPRAAIFLPVGWVPLALAALVVIAARRRNGIGSFEPG